MTGAPIESETPRQEAPQANADIIINPTEGQRRAAAIQRRKRIGKHLSEALIAAVVGGVVTLMVWNHAAPPGTKSAESGRPVVTAANELKSEGKSEAVATTRTETVIPAGAAGLPAKPDTEAKGAARSELAELLPKSEPLALSEKSDPQAAARIERIEPIPAPIALDGRKVGSELNLAAKGAVRSEELAEDAIGASMEGAGDEPLDDGLSVEKAKNALKAEAGKGHSAEVPVIKAKVETAKPAEAAVKAPALPRMPEPKPLAHATEAKAAGAPANAALAIAPVKSENKAAAATAIAPKSDAKAAAPLAQEAKGNFPQSQADGHYLVTAGSYSNALGAERIQKKLADAGIPVRMRKSQMNNHTVHHLLTGPFATAELAGQAVSTIKERTGVEARYVTVAETQASRGAKKPLTLAKPASAPAWPGAAKEASAKSVTAHPTVAKAVAAAPAKAREATVVAKGAAPAKAKEATVAKGAAPAKAKEATVTVAKAPINKGAKEATVAKGAAPAKAKEATIAKAVAPVTTPVAIAPAKETTVAKGAAPAATANPLKEATAAKEITIPRTGEFVAHAGSFSNPANANQLRRRLTERGISSYTKVSTINGKEYTHVILGPFPNQHEADVKMGTFQKETGIVAKAMPIH
ncbi:MAG: SPOR domain-containing protein [Magnetococcus sp. YQC-9]